MTSPDLPLLAAFINARLDEEETAAKRGTPPGWPWEGRALREVAALRSVVADCQRAMSYPANGPLYGLARRTLFSAAAIWQDHPEYAQVTAAQTVTEPQGIP